MKKPAFDLVLYGATSFVGQILSAELLGRHPPGATALRFALAGRSRVKLEQLRSTLGPAAAELPLLLADASDAAALRDLCGRTRVVVSTVGPYALHGEPLLRACVETGTDYCDLTGEAPWIRRMLDRYEAQARRSGARIVHSCGFDSVPSDLGVRFLQQQALARFGAPCTTVKMRVRSLRGGVSGGTAASMVNVVREALGDASVRRGLADPYWLSPAAEPKQARPRQDEVMIGRHDADFGQWIAPFIMSGINLRIVLRSNALAGPQAVPDFRYDEALLTGRGLVGRAKAYAVAAGIGGFAAAAALPPTRWLLERLVLPGPGAGPSPQAQLRGGYDLRFHGRTGAGEVLCTQLSADRDPGYGSTARILAEAGACLALDVPRDRKLQPGGFWTPATLLGDLLIERLQAFAGVRFTLLDA